MNDMNDMDHPRGTLEYAGPQPLSVLPVHADPANPGHAMSLEGMHGSVAVPHHSAAFWKQWRAYVGPALLISIGYMDPGNWGTDLSAGAAFKYELLWVVAVASIMAIF